MTSTFQRLRERLRTSCSATTFPACCSSSSSASSCSLTTCPTVARDVITRRLCVPCLAMCNTSPDGGSDVTGGTADVTADTTRQSERSLFAVAADCWNRLCGVCTTHAGVASVDGKRCQLKCRWWKSVGAKVFLIVVNLLFFIAGWAMVLLGIWLHVFHDSYFYLNLLNDNMSNPVVILDRVPYLLMGIGFLIAAMSFLGCCGACADSICFLSFYTIFLVIVIITETVLGIAVLVSKEEMYDQLMESMQYHVQAEYNRTALPANLTSIDVYRLTAAWDTLQIRMNCCGAVGPQDYRHSAWFNQTPETEGIFVPPSCCLLLNNNPKRLRVADENYCQVEAIMYLNRLSERHEYLKTTGCQSVVMHWLYSYECNVAVIVSVHIVIELVSLVLGCVLMTWVRKKHADYWWCEDEDYYH